jgi:ATP-dependent Clp endopeptidase proteolytic subunit ClpP
MTARSNPREPGSTEPETSNDPLKTDLSDMLGFPDPMFVHLPLGEPPSAPEAVNAYADRFKAQLELYKSGLDIREALRKRANDMRLEELEYLRRTIELSDAMRKDADAKAAHNQALVYTFYDDVSETSVRDAMATMSAWSRREPGKSMEIILNSPGGSVTDGLALYDFLLGLRTKGHHLIVTSLGMAASMGGVLLQAGNERILGRNAFLLIHEIRGFSHGKTSSLRDDLDFQLMLEERLIAILAERSTLSIEEITQNWARKDWWMDAARAVEYGFADRLG